MAIISRLGYLSFKIFWMRDLADVPVLKTGIITEIKGFFISCIIAYDVGS